MSLASELKPGRGMVCNHVPTFMFIDKTGYEHEGRGYKLRPAKSSAVI